MQGCRVAYNSFVLYHNFKHAVDVLQSTFYFLLQIGLLPSYPSGTVPEKHENESSPIAKLIRPFDALTLLIAAIGHDVGHPGVNNMFLVKLNAPLAQLYNDQSVLEAFHCAAYSQILRRHWPTVFHDKAIRKLMISSILATDMGCHSDYMQQLGNLQEKIHESQTTEGWTPKDVETYRILACGLLIKCADISNVARPWSVAEKWTYKLQDEFAHQGEMERNIGLETTLFGGPPELGNMLKLANGQIGFMTIFAHPLFANVADIIPGMKFAADEILINKGVWFTRAEHEKQRALIKERGGTGDGGVSPRSQSPADANRKSYFPSSPFKEKSEKKQTNGDKSSSLRQVEGIASPDEKPTSRPASHRRQSGQRLMDTEAQPQTTTSLPNGVSAKRDSESATPRQTPVDSPGSDSHNNVSQVELNDDTRDMSVSMRAGSTNLPIKQMEEAQKNVEQRTRNSLAGFKFATSHENEPVRSYDPNEQHQPVSAEERSSAPMNDVEHQHMKANMAAAEDNEKPVEKAVTATSRNDGGEITPTPSTEATSYTTGNRSQDALSSPQTTYSHSDARNRAISQPMPMLGQAYSMTSNDSTSREGSKQDFRTTIFSNGGDSASEDARDRKLSTRTLGRKKSDLKRRLQFWKKRSSERSLPEEARVGERSP